MAVDSFRITAILPATPARVYAAWLDPDEHSEFTGGRATSDARVGGKHTAWDDYISGHNLELVPARRIVQAWRTTEFPSGAADSRLELHFEAKGRAETTLLLVHTNIPAGQGSMYKEGWGEHYLEPMREYFRANPDAPAHAGPAKAPATKKPRVAAAPAKKPEKKRAAATTAPKKSAPAKKAAKSPRRK